ncbi:hypothetical protein BDA96_10G315200 [Sorghum bicolor]|nr:hypothetical protein BDA96_10G315200 [Sorghum bicolor]KXG20725.1 hypothetical protein SORBI_3010G243700 [Sorghum bicolor]
MAVLSELLETITWTTLSLKRSFKISNQTMMVKSTVPQVHSDKTNQQSLDFGGNQCKTLAIYNLDRCTSSTLSVMH